MVFAFSSRTTFPMVSPTPAQQHSIWTILSAQAYEHKRTGSPQKTFHPPRRRTSTTLWSCPLRERSLEKKRGQVPPYSVTPEPVYPENSAPCSSNPGVEHSLSALQYYNLPAVDCVWCCNKPGLMHFSYDSGVHIILFLTVQNHQHRVLFGFMKTKFITEKKKKQKTKKALFYHLYSVVRFGLPFGHFGHSALNNFIHVSSYLI